MTWDSHVHLEASRRLAGREPDAAAAPGVFAQLLTDTVRGYLDDDLAPVGGVRLRYNPIGWRDRGVSFADQEHALQVAQRHAGRAGLDLLVYASLKHGRHPDEWRLAIETAAASPAFVGVDVSGGYTFDDPDARPAAGGGPAALAAMRAAADRGLEVALHLGWFDTLDDLGPALRAGVTRIGHGVPLLDAPAWDATLAAAGVTVEVCPSAFLLRTGRPLTDVPVRRWRAAGVGVEVGTDHPVALGTSLARELDLVRQAAAVASGP